MSLFATRDAIADGAVLLRGFCAQQSDGLMATIDAIARHAPFRKMITPGGQSMSAAMTNCGIAGWVTDRKGYRYAPHDPQTGNDWPAMPGDFASLARRAADDAGYTGFTPDACLINRYEPGARMGLHQDKDERDFDQPIVSVSLGAPATFLWGGLKRTDKTRRFTLENGDVVVWGGPSRLVFHGVAPIKDGVRYNLTFRKAL